MHSITKAGWLVVFLAVAGCATGREVKPGGEVIVDRSHEDRPDWLNQRKIEQGPIIVFIGQERSRNLGLGEDGAKLSAVKNLGNSYYMDLSDLVSSDKREITEALDQYLKSGADFAAKNVPISGAATKEIYWEKIEKSTYGELQYFYDVWTIVEISAEDYQRGLRLAVDRVKSEGKPSQEILDKFKAYEDRMGVRH